LGKPIGPLFNKQADGTDRVSHNNGTNYHFTMRKIPRVNISFTVWEKPDIRDGVKILIFTSPSSSKILHDNYSSSVDTR
jgi:hypothetical protein